VGEPVLKGFHMVEIVADRRRWDHRPMSKTITVYGIANCDTVKKARAWLQDHGVAYQFHDFKKQGLPLDHVDRWVGAAGWEALVNRKGTTWRKLDDATRAAVVDAASAKTLMQQQPSVIKRPIVEWGSTTTVGFDSGVWEQNAAR
jgi:arsenate reductase